MTEENKQQTAAEKTTEAQAAALIGIRKLDRIETIRVKAVSN